MIEVMRSILDRSTSLLFTSLIDIVMQNMVGHTGIEPVTSSMSTKRSPTELMPHI